MTEVLDYVPEEDRLQTDVDAALILDEALDLHPMDEDREVLLDDERRDES